MTKHRHTHTHTHTHTPTSVLLRDTNAEISILWSIESGNFGVIDGSAGKEYVHSAGDTGDPGSVPE